MKTKQAIKELKGLTIKDLEVQLKAQEAAYFKLRFAHKVSALENPLQLQEARRHIARIKTFIQQQHGNQKS